jgi:hypothetical protein
MRKMVITISNLMNSIMISRDGWKGVVVVGGASRTLRMYDEGILSMCIEVQSKSMELTNGGLRCA